MAELRSVEGSSPVTAVLSLTIFLAFLLLATQALVHLYTATVVGAATFGVARDAATHGRDCDAAGPGGLTSATEQLRTRLGGVGAGAEISCVDDGEATTLVVRVPSPARVLGGPLRLGAIERAARVRTETVR